MATNPPSRRGGARPGSGHPRRGTYRAKIILTEAQRETARQGGDGNISEGVRRLLDANALTPAIAEHRQLWRHKATGEYYVILWGAVLAGAVGPLALDAARAMQAGGALGPLVDDDELDRIDAAWDRGEFEREDNDG